MDYDVLIIGSGFGGSVAALRLSQKGYRVAVLEQGRRISKHDMDRAAKNLLRLIWAPSLGLDGYFTQHFFRHVNIVGGAGVGGGSLVYAGVLLEPDKRIFEDPAWSELGVDWAGELEGHYATAARMLGCTNSPSYSQMDLYLQATADAMQAGDTFSPAPLGIYFGKPGLTVSDPYFDGAGPTRTGCIQCGECLAGCRYNAKNTLDQNYLYLAENLGAVILPKHKAVSIRPLPGSGYEVESVNPLNGGRHAPLRAKRVILAAGVLGTLDILFRCRDEQNSLPDLSPRLGENVRTNSEAVVGVLSKDKDADFTDGPAISTHFYADAQTHITQNRFPASYSFMKWYTGPFVDDEVPRRRALKTLWAFFRHPLAATASFRARRWHRRMTALTVMQRLDSRVTFRYGRSLFTLFYKGLQSVPVDGKETGRAYLPVANRAAREFAEQSGGFPQNSLLESLFNMSVTAHVLGGCSMGKDRESGVINSRHEVFGYPGLYVVDGSSIPTNIGVNPSLTIAALAERCMGMIPSKR